MSTITAIEGNFPFEHLSGVAEAENWRTEIYRSLYHMHKWWGRRLSSVFHAAILGALHPDRPGAAGWETDLSILRGRSGH